MKILIACEESQEVCKAFRAKGHEAFSCDIQDCSGGHPEWHFKEDIRIPLSAKNKDGTCFWDMIISFPPCTHLAVSGARHFKEKIADGRQQQGIDFFLLFTNHSCEKIIIENPVGIMSTKYRKPDQIINPFQFGHIANKKTCLWLKGVPLLIETNVVKKDVDIISRDGKNRMSKWYYETSCLTRKERAKARSKTFTGIALAMADQWG